LYVCLLVCLIVFLFVFQFVCLFVCLFVFLFVCLSVCLLVLFVYFFYYLLMCICVDCFLFVSAVVDSIIHWKLKQKKTKKTNKQWSFLILKNKSLIQINPAKIIQHFYSLIKTANVFNKSKINTQAAI